MLKTTRLAAGALRSTTLASHTAPACLTVPSRFNSTAPAPAAPAAAEKADTAAVEERLLFPVDAVNGVPPSISHRGVRIFRPARTASQQGTTKDNWRIDFDVQQRWENRLMGWASSGDPVQSTKIEFKSRDDAILFAERHGYDYWVDEPKETKFKKKTYADNFTYIPGKLRMVRTK